MRQAVSNAARAEPVEVVVFGHMEKYGYLCGCSAQAAGEIVGEARQVIDIDIGTLPFVDDPYPLYRQLRDETPVDVSSLGVWVVSRHADVQTVQSSRSLGADLRDWSMFDLYSEIAFGGQQTEVAWLNRSVFLFHDGDEHLRIRKVLARYFTPRSIERLRPSIRQTVDAFVADLEQQELFDGHRDFALPLSTAVISELIGIPPDDRAYCLALAEIIGEAFALPSADRLAVVDAAITEARDYFQSLVLSCRQSPGLGLASVLATARVEGEYLGMDEIVANLILLFDAGHETTAALIGTTLKVLTEDDRLVDVIGRECVSMAAVVDEALRFDAPFQLMRKLTHEPVQLGATIVPADSVVVALIGSGNHDERVFEQPEIFDPTRQFGRRSELLSFGHGSHHCLGAALARVEAEIALDTVLSSAKHLTLDAGGVQRHKSGPVRGYSSIPLQFSTSISKN